MFTRHDPNKMLSRSLRMPGHFSLSAPKLYFNSFREPDLTNVGSPDPSPLDSPAKGYFFPNIDGNGWPTLRLGDLLAFGTPKRPSAPAPAQDHLPNRPRRKGPKHLSFTPLESIRSESLPPRQRTRKLNGKRETARKRGLERHKSRTTLNRKGPAIANLRSEAESLMKPEHMNAQDWIFLKQLRNLEWDEDMDQDLEQYRLQMARAADGAEKRRWEHMKRDKATAKMWGKEQDEKAVEDRRKIVEEFMRAREESWDAHCLEMEEEALHLDEERQRAHDAMEREVREEQERLYRQEMARKVKEDEERRKREDEERRLQEERQRQIMEEARRLARQEIDHFRRENQERAMREERERRARSQRERRMRDERERALREEVERLRRQAREREAREEHPAREAEESRTHPDTEQARPLTVEEQTRQHFALYEAKWNELRVNNSLPPIDVREMPWPVFTIIESVDQITHQDVRTFLFHPLRPGVEGKSGRDKVKSEVLRFHPDKFNTRILPKIRLSQQAVAQELAGQVARILTRILAEEEEQ